jgi:hypothetical protein
MNVQDANTSNYDSDNHELNYGYAGISSYCSVMHMLSKNGC